MKRCFNPTCDRHGHMLTGFGGPPQTMALFIVPTAEEVTLFSATALSGSNAGEHRQLNLDGVPAANRKPQTRNIFNYLSRIGNRKIGDVPWRTLAAKKVESAGTPAKKIESKPLSIRRIIVAVNLTKNCEATVRYAAEIARYYGASLYITYVFWPSLRTRGDYLIDQEQRESLEKLTKLANEARDIVPWCKSALLAGEPAERLSSLAHDIHADLIIAASSDPILTQLLNVAEAMKMPCSVLVYHDKNA